MVTELQNHLTPIKMTNIKNQAIVSADKNVEKLSPLRTAGWIAEWRSHCGKQYEGSSKNYTQNLPRDLAIAPPGYTQRTESRVPKRYLYAHVHGCILYRLRHGGNPSVCQWMNGQNVLCTHSIIQL